MDQSEKIILRLPELNKMINDAFIPIWDCKDRFLVLYGSRGSSKSDFVAKNIIIRMMTHKFFRGVCIRKVERTINGSVFANFKMNIQKMGLSQYFKINENPMKIECLLTGNMMVFRGMDEPEKIKSITNISCLWFEEEIDYSYEDYITVETSMRAPQADFIQTIFTINPVLEDYESTWFWKKFFQNELELSFRKQLPSNQWATIHHSTFRDNKWLKQDFISTMEDLKNNDPYMYSVYNLGIFTQKIATGQFYKDFTLAKNTVEDKLYDPELPLHLSFDFNNNPYSACTIYQGDKEIENTIYLIDEICLKSPRNKLIEVLNELCRKYAGHGAGMHIYGDPNGYKEDTTKEKGDNAYRMIFDKLKEFKPTDKTTRVAPSVRARQNWLNDIMAYDDQDISVYISRKCRNAINEFSMLREDPIKGGKLKEKWKDPETDIVSEKYGHISDSFEYMMCVLFKLQFDKHRNPGLVTNVTQGRRVSQHRANNY